MAVTTLTHSASFRDLKKLLAGVDVSAGKENDELPIEVKQRTHMICSKYLGGVWKRITVDELRISRMKGGMSNMLFLCRLPTGLRPIGQEPDKTLLRVYFNPETETHLVAESVIFTLLSERALGPRLYGIFNGGRLEEYIVSRPLSCQELGHRDFSTNIAIKLAQVHHLDVPIGKDPEYIGEALERWLDHLLEVVWDFHAFPMRTHDGSVVQVTEDLLREEIRTIRWLDKLIKYRVHAHNRQLTIPTYSSNANSNNNHSKNGCDPSACDTTEDGCERSSAREITSDGDCVKRKSSSENGTEDKLLVLDICDLKTEFEIVRKCIERSESPVVFCHNDLQEGNVLKPNTHTEAGLSPLPSPRPHEEQNGSAEFTNGGNSNAMKTSVTNGGQDLVFIDFEYASYNYRGFDFANHFCEWAIDYAVDDSPFYTIDQNTFPSRQDQLAFFDAYIRSCAGDSSLGLHAGESLQEGTDRLIREFEPFVPVSHFFWGVWALLQVELSPVEFGFEEYGKQRLGLYFQLKNQLLALAERPPPPSSPVTAQPEGGSVKFVPPPRHGRMNNPSGDASSKTLPPGPLTLMVPKK